MKLYHLLFVLLASVYVNASATTSQAPIIPEVATPTEIPLIESPVKHIILSKEESGFIKEQCQSFAQEDEVTPSKLPDYLENCVNELTMAVKIALNNRLLQESEAPAPAKAKKAHHRSSKPQAM